MRDKWIAECSPCKWETQHDSEADAITAAESHVDELHRKVHPLARADKHMGCVTQRTILDPAEIPDAPAPPAPAQEPPAPEAPATPAAPTEPDTPAGA